MISGQSRTEEWIIGIRKIYPGRDPILIEKMIMALILVESLRLVGLDFIFKGGTSLLLVLGTLQRFSIDIDIILQDYKNQDKFFDAVLEQGIFNRIEECKRSGEVPKHHYKFYFLSNIQKKESHILLDILYEKNLYPKLNEVDVNSSIISLEGQITKVKCPTKECLLGDKLTAFAPHTTGILYGQGKDLEIAKQLFDIAILFDNVTDINIIRRTFEKIVQREMVYRGIDKKYKPIDVLMDTFDTSILIGTRGRTYTKEYAELISGFKKMAAFIYSGFFSLDSAILCASKVAYLVSLLMSGNNKIVRFEKNLDISTWLITDENYNKLNKLKKSSPEAFYYFYQALHLLGL